MRGTLAQLALICLPIAVQAGETPPPSPDGPTLRVRLKQGQVRTIPIEDYLVGVVASETWPNWHPESLKAQAVASRSFALRKRLDAKGAWDLESTVRDQVYDHQAGERRPDAAAAVAATRGEVLTHNGRPIRALFHSTCGGRTSAPSLVWGGEGEPYLQPVECGYCQISPRASWETRLPLSTVRSRLAALQLGGLATLRLTPLAPDAAGRCREVEVRAGGRSQRLTAQRLRALLGFDVLRSAIFAARVDGDELVLTGRGSGHGVGLCQWGAEGRARAGQTHVEILQHYYPGAELRRAY